MKLLKVKARLLLCGVIIAVFFIPSYNNISGFGFINYAFSEVGANTGITETDVLIAILALLLVPFSALVILVLSAVHHRIRKIYLALPLLFMLFFFGVLFFSARNGTGDFSSPKAFFQMQVGFYITALACCLLLFTKTYRKRRRRRSVPPSEVIATA